MELQRPHKVVWTSAWLWLAAAADARTQQPAQGDQNPSSGANLQIFNPLESYQIWLTGGIIVSGLLFFAGQIALLRRVRDVSADDVVRNCSITIVIIAATVLIVAGYNSQQTAQAFGLFGTIIGYLLGRSAGSRDRPRERPPEEGGDDG